MQSQPPNPHYAPTDYPPPYTQPQPYPPAPYPYGYAQQQDHSTAIVLEAILSVFGIYGIGWMYRGHVATGVALLVLGFVWVGIAALISIFTLGIGLLCVGPLHLVFIALDVIALNNTLRQPVRS
jgi:TM2 domain-containing membrane protein YozV